MRRSLLVSALSVTASLSACSAADQPGSSPLQGRDTLVESADPAAAKGQDGAVKVSLPQLAYAYSLHYLLPGDRIADTQDAHRRLCESMGPARCQLLALERASADEASSDALLKMRVATAEATRFEQLLAKDVTGAGGRVTDTQVKADDVSKQIVDTEARIRQRELLVARLTQVLRSRDGKVADLVEAERSVAQAQEELDQARGWLSELKGRVAMSDFDIRYGAIAPSASPESTGAQLGEAAIGSGATFLIGLRALFTLAIYLAPWLLLLLPVVLLARRAARRAQAPAQP